MTFEVPALAAGFASKFDEIGPYIGFGSLIAVVAMAILVFAQGRELQRLREWAGSSPERLDQLEQEVRDAAASRLATPAPRPGVPMGVPGQQVPGAPPRPPGAPGAVPPGPPGVAAPGAAPGSPVVGAGSSTPPGTPGGPGRPTPPRPTPPGVPGAPARAGVVAASSTAGGPRAATAAGAAATARDRERDQKPERSIGQIIGVSVVAVVVLLALLFAFNVIGGGGDGPVDDSPNAGPRADVTPTTTRRTQAFPPTEITTAVLNASGRDKLAGDVSDIIDQRLRLVSDPTNYTSDPKPTFTSVQWVGDATTASDNRQNRAAASAVLKVLKETVPGARMLRMTDEVKAIAPNKRLVVIVGPDYAAATPVENGTSTGGTTGSTGSTSGSAGSTTTGQLGTQSDGLGTDGTATP